MMDAKEWAAKEFWPSQPRCLGFDGQCDGDLVGEEHIPTCPMFGKQPISAWELAEAYAAYALKEVLVIGRSTLPGDAFIRGKNELRCYKAGVATTCDRIEAARLISPASGQKG